MVTIDIDYLGQLRCRASHEPSGNTLETDAPVDNQGKGETFSPTDLVATALGSCILTILGIVAERNDLDIAGAHVQVRKEMVSEPIRRIGRLQTTVDLPVALDEKARRRLESAARMCPVHKSLHPDVDAPIEFRYR